MHRLLSAVLSTDRQAYIISNSKTSLIPWFALAWATFAHALAFHGEDEHVIPVYSTCAQMITKY